MFKAFQSFYGLSCRDPSRVCRLGTTGTAFPAPASAFGILETFYVSLSGNAERARSPLPRTHLQVTDGLSPLVRLFLRTVVPSGMSSGRMWGLITCGSLTPPERYFSGVCHFHARVRPSQQETLQKELWDHRWTGRGPGNSQAREAERKLTRLGDVALPLDGASEPGSEDGQQPQLGGLYGLGFVFS